LKYLLGVNVNYQYYTISYILSFLLFAPFVFLSRIPIEFQTDYDLGYSKALTFNLTYISPIILTILAAIMYLYFGKILIAGELPKNIISGLVLTFGIIGISTFSMLQPMDAKNVFMKIIKTHFFYIFSIPLTLFLYSIYIEIFEVGITIKTYLLALFAIWFTISTIYILVKKNSNLRVINVTLSVLLILASFGPWGIANVGDYKFNSINSGTPISAHTPSRAKVERYSLYSTLENAIKSVPSISEYDYIQFLNLNSSKSNILDKNFDSNPNMQYSFQRDDGILTISYKDFDKFYINTKSIINDGYAEKNNKNIRTKYLEKTLENGNLKIVINIYRLNAQITEVGIAEFTSLSAFLLVDIKD
jgi:hypothetical protein